MAFILEYLCTIGIDIVDNIYTKNGQNYSNLWEQIVLKSSGLYLFLDIDKWTQLRYYIYNK